MSEYFEKLKDPRWQRKKSWIMERDDFTCRHCGEKDKTLVVHHGYYEFKKEPWEYENGSLLTLCGACHDSAEILRCDGKKVFGFLTNLRDSEIAIGFMRGLELKASKDFSRVELFDNFYHVKGMFMAISSHVDICLDIAVHGRSRDAIKAVMVTTGLPYFEPSIYLEDKLFSLQLMWAINTIAAAIEREGGK